MDRDTAETAKGQPDDAAAAAREGARLFEAGVRYFQAGRLLEAGGCFEKVLELFPGHPEALHLLGIVAYKSGDPEKSARAISQAIRAAPGNPSYHSSLGNALLALRRFSEALASFDAALGLKPDFAEAFSNRGNVLQELGRFEEAVQSYEKALALKPDYAAALHNCGNALQKMKRFEEAIGEYDKAIALNANYTNCYYSRGNALRELERYDEAILSYDKALSLQPHFAEALNNKGVVLERMKKLEEALIIYGHALAMKPDYAEAFNNRGNALLELSRFDEALKSYGQALAIKPDYAEAYNNLGHALAALGRFDDAARAYMRAAELGHKAAPHHAAALQGHTTETAPAEYVRELFDSYASRFDAHLTDELDYRGPQRLRELINKSCQDMRFKRIADLGCGTGLSGSQFRDIAGELVGVDLSAKMLAQAGKKQIYDKLVASDILGFLDASDQDFDLFLLADVVIYTGALDQLFYAISRRAMAGAILALNSEICDGDSFQLLKSGRYAHSRSYLESQLVRIGAQVLAWENMEIRKEKDAPCYGHYIIASLASASP